MERFSSRPPRQSRAGSAKGADGNQEDFSEMVDVTTRRPGVFGKLLVLSLIVVSIAVTAFVGYAIVNGVGSQNLVDKDNYQAVFLSDGQIYFGHLSDVDQSYSRLESIFYLQVQNANQVQQAGSEAQQPSITLVKLGNEIHGPIDQMVINSDQILFWENLKDDGQVAEAIARYFADQANGADAATADVPVDTTDASGDAETTEN